MSKDIDIKMEMTVEETMQGILNKINDSLELINGQVSSENGEPPHDLRVARVINELSQSYTFLAKNANSQKNNTL